MRVAIDGYEANVPQRLGSSQVSFELLRHLERLDRKNEYTILVPNPPMDDLPKERKGWSYKLLKPSKLWTRIALPAYLYLTKPRVDVILSPTHYIPRFSPVPRVAIIFDLAYFHFPTMFNKKDLWQLTNWSKFSIINANHILTISNFTKGDIKKLYKIEDNKLTVVYPGFNKKLFKVVKDRLKIKPILQKYNIDSPYIIYIGTIQPRKNLPKLIEAMRDIQDVKLVVVGKTTGPGRRAWMFQQTLDAPKKFGVDEKVIFTGYVPTSELPFLLSGAKLFVLPSLWEGFGIPVVEAMACGVPVAVSDISSLPEIAGEAGEYFNPNSVADIAQAINKLLLDDKLRSKKVQLGLKQAQKFSWDEFAKKTIEVLERVKNDHI